MDRGIFICYRREDSAGVTGRIYDRLGLHFKDDHVFKDTESIDPGDDFVDDLEKAVSTCDVLIAVIGKNWLTIKDRSNRRRLDNPIDFVRREIKSALERNIRVIPVLVDEAIMPDFEDLPDDIKKLARRNALEVSSGNRFDSDMTRLNNVLEKSLNDLKAKADAEESARKIKEAELQKKAGQEEAARKAKQQKDEEEQKRKEEKDKQDKIAYQESIRKEAQARIEEEKRAEALQKFLNRPKPIYTEEEFDRRQKEYIKKIKAGNDTADELAGKAKEPRKIQEENKGIQTENAKQRKIVDQGRIKKNNETKLNQPIIRQPKQALSEDKNTWASIFGGFIFFAIASTVLSSIICIFVGFDKFWDFFSYSFIAVFVLYIIGSVTGKDD